MEYCRSEAKAYARANLKGIWAAALQPFAHGSFNRRSGHARESQALG